MDEKIQEQYAGCCADQMHLFFNFDRSVFEISVFFRLFVGAPILRVRNNTYVVSWE